MPHLCPCPAPPPPHPRPVLWLMPAKSHNRTVLLWFLYLPIIKQSYFENRIVCISSWNYLFHFLHTVVWNSLKFRQSLRVAYSLREAWSNDPLMPSSDVTEHYSGIYCNKTRRTTVRALGFLRGNKLLLHCKNDKMYNMTVGLRLSYVHWFKASIQLESSGVFRFPNTTTTFLSKPFWCFFF